MRHNLLEILVYPLLLINIAIGFLMLTASHTFILIVIDRLNQSGSFESMELGPYYALQQSASMISIILIAIIGIIVFPILERYYANGIQQSMLTRRVCSTVGVQLIYLGVVQIAIQLIAEVAITLDNYLILIIGTIFFAISKKVLREQSNNTSESSNMT